MAVVTEAIIRPLKHAEIRAVLTQRTADAAWTEETPSLLHTETLAGLEVTLPSGKWGWIVFQQMPFQLTHFVLSPWSSSDLAQALLCAVHLQNPQQDTKIENLPADYPHWDVLQSLGYIEVFRRIEMVLPLSAE